MSAIFHEMTQHNTQRDGAYSVDNTIAADKHPTTPQKYLTILPSRTSLLLLLGIINAILIIWGDHGK